MHPTALFLTALLTLVIFAGVALGDEDYYDVLGLEAKDESSERDIKTAWRKLSKQYHPDLKGESTREQYVKIQRAYEVLSDRKKRKIYDMRGEEGLKQLEQQANQPQRQDPFAMFFGGGNGGQANRGQNVDMMLLVTLEDIYNGAAHSVKLTKQKLCRQCKGTGADSKSDFKKCKHCDGRGVVTQRIQLAPGFVQQAQQPCPHCGGKGQVIKKKCRSCGGAKVVKAEQTLSIDIEQGTPENHQLVFDMEADQTPDMIPGDIVFTVVSEPHPTFVRKGNDLLMTLKISLKEALLGVSKLFKHLDGHEFEVDQEGVIQFGQKLKIASEGMPVHNVPSEKGDLIVTFEVQLPSHLTPVQEEELGKIFPK